jgi:hypothetical protein
MILKRRLCWAFFLACLCGCQSDNSLRPKSPSEPVRSFSNDDWAKVLSKIATPDGYVRWDVVQSDDDTQDAMSKYIGLLSAVSPRNQSSLFATPNDAKAYWINAYNALSIYWVVRHGYPGTIPAQRPETFTVGGKPMRLADIDAVLQSDSKDRMVFFALNGCARSDPPLHGTPYDGAVLEAQLTDQGHRYLSDPRGVQRDGDTLTLALPLLAFFTDSVQKSANGASPLDLAALLPYAQSDSPLVSAKDVAKVEFTFDYSLNRPPR